MPDMNTPQFVHLRVHTEYSLVDGLVRIKPLVARIAESGMGAVAVTDQSNLFAMVKFYKAAQSAGVKPLIGVDLWLRPERDAASPFRLTLICQHAEGYRNLTRLVSRSYQEGQHRGVPMIEFSWLEEQGTSGLIALSGGVAGELGRVVGSGKPSEVDLVLDRYRRLFPERFYLEVTRTGRPGEEEYLHEVVALAGRKGVPVVATNDVRFLSPGDFEAHEARVCIHDGRTLGDPRRPRRYSEEQYLKSPREMAELFDDLPEALENSVEIARRCNLELTLGENFLPDFPIPGGLGEADYLRRESESGLGRRLVQIRERHHGQLPVPEEAYRERLALELDVIIQMGFPGYFLIVADFIRWARENGVPVGPGRGSGAGSLVAYCLGITDLDPLEYDLLFERFLNPERVSMPDFDVDFCMEGRDRVIEYVAQKYGRDRVSQIITYGTMAARAVVRDVGRVLGHSYGFVDRVAKLIPFEIGMTLEKALEQSDELRESYQNDDEIRALIDLARSLEGITRNAGKHAGGVVIAPSVLTDFTPLYCEQGGGNLVTQFDKDDVEGVGLVKFDFLGLRTLTIIDWAVTTINRQRESEGEPPLDISAIPLDDPETFDLLKRCATTAVFQLESRGMKDLIKRLQPDCFEDIVALVALFRPGPLQSGMVDDFINRKHGRARVDYPHPDLEPILKPTYGVILYQEQVMQIAQVLAGYTLGGADLLRRAMGKKKPEEMAKQRDIFMKGALERQVDAKTAGHIFDLMEKFAGYGFNKSHSAAYALVSYQTAWLKAHFPAAFMAAVLSADMDNTDKVVGLIDECRALSLTVLPPDINSSDYAFTVVDDAHLHYGLGAIKGVGEAALEGILAERAANGPFRDLIDFCQRIDPQKVNRRVLEALIRAGALDRLGSNRATLMAQLPTALQIAEQQNRVRAVGQTDMFGLAQEAMDETASAIPDSLIELEEWDEEQRLIAEKETLGLYLTGHPIQRYEKELERFTSGRIIDFVMEEDPQSGRGKARREQSVVLAGLVVALRVTTSRRGGKMAFVTLDDRSARIEITLFSESYEKYREMLVKDRLLVVEGTLSFDDYTERQRLTVERLFDIDQARQCYAKCLQIVLQGSSRSNGLTTQLKPILDAFREGSCPVWIEYHNETASTVLTLGREWRVHPSDQLLARLAQLESIRSVELLY
ncbi:MAG: DNA polymerase III subunit alpha [Gammaproteobacteria bacterium]